SVDNGRCNSKLIFTQVKRKQVVTILLLGNHCEMQKIIENKKLELKYKKGFGAWTYHLIIPSTAHIEGKWGDLKVSGLIDDYELKEMNLAPRKNEDKMISINKEIRNAIGKSGGDVVTVTLYLHTQNSITKKSEI